MTPYEIGILLHYHTRPVDPNVSYEMGSALWRETISQFIVDDLLVSNNGPASYKLTDRGTFYVTEGLCSVPLPVADWKIPK